MPFCLTVWVSTLKTFFCFVMLWFLYVCSTCLLKTGWEKEKLLKKRAISQNFGPDQIASILQKTNEM